MPRSTPSSLPHAPGTRLRAALSALLFSLGALALVGLMGFLVGGCAFYQPAGTIAVHAGTTYETQQVQVVGGAGGGVIVVPGEGAATATSGSSWASASASASSSATVTATAGGSAGSSAAVYAGRSEASSEVGTAIEGGAGLGTLLVTTSGGSGASWGGAGSGSSSAGGAATGSSSASGSMTASASAGGVATGSSSVGSAGGGGELAVEAQVQALLAALEVQGAGPGVAALPGSGYGHRPGLGDLLGAGVAVDGMRVSLAELERMCAKEAPGGLSASASGSSPVFSLSAHPSVEARVELEHGSLPAAGGETHVVVRLRGAAPSTAAAAARRPAIRITLVLDRSSSMQRAWPRVITAAQRLVGNLQADDTIHVVAYGNEATEVLAPSPVGDGTRARDALAHVSVGGGTNISAGLEMAYRGLSRSGGPALVILLSDGVPNAGLFEARELASLAKGAAERYGAVTSAVGLGTSFDEVTLRAIAREGQGRYHLSLRPEEVARSLGEELEVRARVAAVGARLSLRLAPGVSLVEGPSEAVAQGGSVAIAMPQLAAGEERRLLFRVRVPAGSGLRSLGGVEFGFRAGGTQQQRSVSLRVGTGAPELGAGDLSAEAGKAVIDAHLAAALDRAAQAVRVGDGAAAQQALAAHSGWVMQRPTPTLSANVRVRASFVEHLGQALAALVGGASSGQRVELSLRLGALSARLGR